MVLTYVKDAVDAGFEKISQFSENLEHSRRALPSPHAIDDADDAPHSKVATVIQHFRDQIKRGNPFSLDPSALLAIVDAISNSKALDDRKFLLEHLLVIMSRLPTETAISKRLSDAVITMLYNDLPHPPATYVGKGYAFRTADGSNNNVLNPDLGKAGMPYSRSVQSVQPMPQNELPSPELVFDTLLKREKIVPHPTGLSSMFFAFATLVIHSVFRTDQRDWSINSTSSYVDLAPLYGHNQERQDQVRKKDGYGGLHPDVFAEDRLLFLPPAASALLVLFSRNHNYIARKLLAINERGTWQDPSKLSSDKLLAQDEEIFQTARLINCGWFATVVFSDYLAQILGTVRDGSCWTLDPFSEIRDKDHSFIERGQGNSCSVEFNLLYRWHSTISEVDEKWLENIFHYAFDNKPFDQIGVRDFQAATAKLRPQADITTWTFNRLERGPDGRFKDSDLARILQEATGSVASAFKARGTPEVMRIVEIMTILQGRAWGTCSMNEFRKFLGLKPFSSFEEWNSNKDIAQAAQKLYGHPDRLELHVGLQGEEAKPVIDGAGLCPGYTVSRAILADAIALTRGDRFYTADFTPHNLTTWGFNDCARDNKNPSWGGALGRLLLRTLPDHYPEDSVWTWFPLTVPQTMKESLEKLGLADRYDFARPGVAPKVTAIEHHKEVAAILKNPTFKTIYGPRARTIIEGPGFFLPFDDPIHHSRERELVVSTLIPDAAALNDIARYYHAKAQALIAEKSFTLSASTTKSVDIVNDVINLVPMHWISRYVGGLPLKTSSNVAGHIFEQQLIHQLKDVFSFIFLEGDADKVMKLEATAQKHTDFLLGYIKSHVANVTTRGIIGTFLSWLTPDDDDAVDFLKKLGASGKSVEELSNSIFAIVVGASVEYSQGLIHVVNLYLEDDRRKEYEDICRLARSNDPKSDALLEGYVREGLRIDPPVPGVYRDVTADTLLTNDKDLRKGARLFLSLSAANRDAYPQSNVVNPQRPKDAYYTGDGVHRALGDDFVYKTGAQILKAIFKLKNVRRAHGPSGRLRRHVEIVHGTPQYLYLDSKQNTTPFAGSMILQYDE